MECPFCDSRIGQPQATKVRVEDGLDRFDVLMLYCSHCSKVLGVAQQFTCEAMDITFPKVKCLAPDVMGG